MTIQTIDNMMRSPIIKKQEFLQDSIFSSRSTESVLIDLSNYARSGVRGEQASQVLDKAGLNLPDKTNRVTESDSGSLLRLSAKEYWMLANLENNTLPKIDHTKGAYTLFCQDSHAWFALKSPFKAEVMAKLCAVDLREIAFPEGMIAQTTVAGTNAIVVHHFIGKDLGFSILCDRSVAHYLWEVVLDALHEFTDSTAEIKTSTSS